METLMLWVQVMLPKKKKRGIDLATKLKNQPSSMYRVIDTIEYQLQMFVFVHLVFNSQG